VSVTPGYVDNLRARITVMEEALHRQFNAFENITVADTLDDAKEMAHAQIALATVETGVKP
jgi:hypothetical protein